MGGMIGALVVNLTCEVRRVAKLPSEPRGDAYQIRQAKYVDSSHSNTRTSQGALGQGVAALQNTLVQKHGEILPYPRPTWSRTTPPHLEPKAPLENVQCRRGGTLLAGGTTYGGTQLAVGTTRRHMRTR